jgi:hypothetical protein
MTQVKANIKKKTEITPYVLSDYNGVKLELNSQRNYGRYSNTQRLNNTLLNTSGSLKK